MPLSAVPTPAAARVARFDASFHVHVALALAPAKLTRAFAGGAASAASPATFMAVSLATAAVPTVLRPLLVGLANPDAQTSAEGVSFHACAAPSAVTA